MIINTWKDILEHRILSHITQSHRGDHCAVVNTRKKIYGRRVLIVYSNVREHSVIFNASTDIPMYMIRYKEKDPCTSSTHHIVKIQNVRKHCLVINE